MGSSRWSDKDWTSYSTSRSYSSKTVDEIYESSKMEKDLDPKGVKVRESRDSAENPNSNAIIVGMDDTGSMDCVLDVMVKEGLKTLFTEIYDRKPVVDPHIMVMAIGDAWCDSAPLQVSQFEADIAIIKQLERIYLERGGGGNMCESYNLPWYFAAQHTSIDCFEKRNKKGYLFTIGDEEPAKVLKREHVKGFIGDTLEADITDATLLNMVSKTYEVFHISVQEGSNFTGNVMPMWTKLLGQRVLPLSDHKKMAEVIISAIEVNEGKDIDSVVSSWKGKTSVVVRNAVGGLTKRASSSGVVRL